MLAPRQELKCAPQGLAVALAESIASFPLSHKGHGYSFYSLGGEMRQDHVGMGKASEVLCGGVMVGSHVYIETLFGTSLAFPPELGICILWPHRKPCSGKAPKLMRANPSCFAQGSLFCL